MGFPVITVLRAPGKNTARDTHGEMRGYAISGVELRIEIVDPSDDIHVQITQAVSTALGAQRPDVATLLLLWKSLDETRTESFELAAVSLPRSLATSAPSPPLPQLLEADPGIVAS